MPRIKKGAKKTDRTRYCGIHLKPTDYKRLDGFARGEGRSFSVHCAMILEAWLADRVKPTVATPAPPATLSAG
jgi:hypothetical protein